MALAFQRPDVDAFLDEIDADQFEEWCAFFALEPQGWQALRPAVTRLSYMVAQSGNPKRLKERDYEFNVDSGGGRSAAGERVRWEAMAIRQQIATGSYEG